MDRVELASITGGEMRITAGADSYPVRWRFDPQQEYLLALETERGRWYRSEMLISSPEAGGRAVTRANLAARFPEMLAEMGEVERGRTLTLPAHLPRRITLLHEDGTPLAGIVVEVDVLVSRQNHCGIAMGLGRGQGAGSTDDRPIRVADGERAGVDADVG
jgi:hypothetical protein